MKNSSLSVGFFLALRDLRRGNPWTTGLIIFVMTLTFFNMIILNGILGGLASGLINDYRKYYSADVVITPSTEKNSIEQSDVITAVVHSLPTLHLVTNRYTAPANLEYNYRNKIKTTDLAESANGTLTGIDPIAEDKITHLSDSIVAGSWLEPTDVDQVVIGSGLLQQYSTVRSAASNIGTRVLKTAGVGSRLRITVNGEQKEVTIKGIVNTSNTTIDSRIFMVHGPARELMGRKSLNANEIAIQLTPGASDAEAKEYITKNLGGNYDVVVQTAREALPGGVLDIIKTFNALGNMIGGISLIVASVTIFIVIFVNAITRRKFIGILKGIGISSHAIETSYVLQAFFYAFCGTIISSVFIYFFLKPYIDLHPIVFPIAQSRLAITAWDLIIRAFILIFTALISGFIPAWLVTKQNTLDAILGR